MITTECGGMVEELFLHHAATFGCYASFSLSQFPLVPFGMGGVFGNKGFFKADAESLCQLQTITGVGIVACPDMTLLYKQRDTFHSPGRVLTCNGLFFRGHQTP